MLNRSALSGATTAPTAAEKACKVLDPTSLVGKEPSTSTTKAAAARKLSLLASRIRALEDALLIESDDQHPLLAHDSRIKIPQHDVETGLNEESGRAKLEKPLDAGTLSVVEGKGESFLGAVAAEVSVGACSFGVYFYLHCIESHHASASR